MGETYVPSGQISAIVGTGRSPQSGLPEEEPTPELELELEVTPELEVVPELEGKPELEVTPELDETPELDPDSDPELEPDDEPVPIGVGNTSPEHPAVKRQPRTARATGNGAKRGRSMRQR